MIAELCRVLMRNLSVQGGSIGRVEELLGAADAIGLDRDRLVQQLESVLEERIALRLLTPPKAHANFGQRRRAVHRRLVKMIEPARLQTDLAAEAELVALVTKIQTAVDMAADARRQGIGDTEVGEISGLLKAQRFRCAACGVPLRHSIRRRTNVFPSGYEPVLDETLEHRTPFYLVGNSTAFEVLCQGCNTLKNDKLGVQEDGLVLCGNTFRPRDHAQVLRRVAFWSLNERPSCADPQCEAGAQTSCMLLAPRFELHPLGVDNLTHFCIDHAPIGLSYWLHEELSARPSVAG
jgi:hypothetical protein